MTTSQQTKALELTIAAIQALDLEPIKFKLMALDGDDQWTQERADLNELGYRRFLTLVAKYPGESIAPNKDVDKFWHGHILDTMKYAEDCQNVFGFFLHHFPYLGMRDEEDAEERIESARLMDRLSMEEFGESCYRTGPQLGSQAAYSGTDGLAKRAAYSGTDGLAKQAAYSGTDGLAKQAAYSGTDGLAKQAAYSGTDGLAKQAAYSGTDGLAKQAAYSGTDGLAKQAAYSGTDGLAKQAAYSGTDGLAKQAAYSGTDGLAKQAAYSGTDGLAKQAAYSGTDGLAKTRGLQAAYSGPAVQQAMKTGAMQGQQDKMRTWFRPRAKA
jgi:hypothetical protein